MTFSMGQTGSNLAQCPDVKDVSHWQQLADAGTSSLEVLYLISHLVFNDEYGDYKKTCKS